MSMALGWLAASPVQSSSGARIDPGYRSRIEQTVAAIVRQDDTAASRIELLREFADGRRQDLLLQLALYLADATGTEQSMAGALIVQHFEFTPDEKIGTVLPHLGAAKGAFRKVLTELLGTIDRPDRGAPDFKVYEPLLLKQKQAPPAALIRYLYEVSPGAAVETMLRVYEGASRRQAPVSGRILTLEQLLAGHTEPASWSDADLAEARGALRALLQEPVWWLRLYAGAVLRDRPVLATPDLAMRVADDASPLVKESLAP
jgi:hypothetical protein